MIVAEGYNSTVRFLKRKLLEAPEVDVGSWHSQDVSGVPQLVSRELQDFSFAMELPSTAELLADTVKPNLPWAENHFMERVCGEPLNPPPSAAEWPYAQKGHEQHTKDEKFSHTYPERMWPKQARYPVPARDRNAQALRGIRFPYGDLEDVVRQLAKDPLTRQAYLPIWFPEDTGAVHGERVPCSLGYHFMIRNDKLSVTYMIRSCDFVRHFADDVYMAGRLCQWVRAGIDQKWGENFAEQTGGHPDDHPLDIGLGTLTMHVMSMHIFQGDIPKLEREVA